MNIQTNIKFKNALIKMAKDKKKANSQLERKPVGGFLDQKSILESDTH